MMADEKGDRKVYMKFATANASSAKGSEREGRTRRRRGRKREKSRTWRMNYVTTGCGSCCVVYSMSLSFMSFMPPGSLSLPTTKRKNEPPSLCYCLFQPLSFFASLFSPGHFLEKKTNDSRGRDR